MAPDPDPDKPAPSRTSEIFHSLADGLSGDDQEWLGEVLVRQEQEIKEADEEQRPRSKPVW